MEATHLTSPGRQRPPPPPLQRLHNRRKTCRSCGGSTLRTTCCQPSSTGSAQRGPTLRDEVTRLRSENSDLKTRLGTTTTTTTNTPSALDFTPSPQAAPSPLPEQQQHHPHQPPSLLSSPVGPHVLYHPPPFQAYGWQHGAAGATVLPRAGYFAPPMAPPSPCGPREGSASMVSSIGYESRPSFSALAGGVGSSARSSSCSAAAPVWGAAQQQGAQHHHRHQASAATQRSSSAGLPFVAGSASATASVSHQMQQWGGSPQHVAVSGRSRDAPTRPAVRHRHCDAASREVCEEAAEAEMEGGACEPLDLERSVSRLTDYEELYFTYSARPGADRSYVRDKAGNVVGGGQRHRAGSVPRGVGPCGEAAACAGSPHAGQRDAQPGGQHDAGAEEADAVAPYQAARRCVLLHRHAAPEAQAVGAQRVPRRESWLRV